LSGILLFHEKEWLFETVYADRGGGNRFIFFSGVVNPATPYFLGPHRDIDRLRETGRIPKRGGSAAGRVHIPKVPV
jgi:hypothetical protein